MKTLLTEVTEVMNQLRSLPAEADSRLSRKILTETTIDKAVSKSNEQFKII